MNASARPGPQRRGWLAGTVGAFLIIALVAAVIVQGRLARLLNLTTQYQDDYLQLNLGQIENEYLRLRMVWRDSLGAERVDREALQLRYDIFLSRVDLLGQRQAMRLAKDRSDLEHTVEQLNRFIAHADTLLGANPTAQPDAVALAALLPELEALDAPLHSFMLDGAHHVAAQIAQRTMSIRQYNQIAVALTVTLCVTTLIFALITMHQMRRLEQRGRALEDLATSLREAQAAAEAASQAKSAFLANMSHEIRTPFQGLLGMLSLLQGTGPGPKQASYLRTATESAQHLLAILNDILDMSKLESGSMQIHSGPVSLPALIAEIESLMRAQAASRDLALSIELDPALPERILCDSTRLKQILFNLLSNAIKFTDAGSVSMQVTRHGTQIDFAVRDTGIGMDAATLARLFQRFTQGDPSPSRRHGGSGLGLEISRNLARLMDGDIAVQSAPGAGSTFVLRLPLREPEEALSAGAAAADDASRAARRLHVLVAEDHPVNQIYLQAVLERLGHTSVLAENGQEALRRLADGARFDLVLMDLHMPVLDGLESARRIRALANEAAAVPIVAVTADAFPETRERCRAAGMNGFLAKPVDPDQLAEAIDSVVA